MHTNCYICTYNGFQFVDLILLMGEHDPVGMSHISAFMDNKWRVSFFL